MKSIIKLFKSVLIDTKRKRKRKASKEILECTIRRGFIFSPEVIYNYTNDELKELSFTVDTELGLSSKEMNSTFHKSWKKVKDASMEQLVMEQIIHYITTYGFESICIYDKDSVYIPNEKLEIPKVKLDKISLFVIKGLTKEELKEKLLNMLKSGIALKLSTLADIINIADKFVKFDKNDISVIKNKEMKIMLYEHLKIVPENAIEFLRYIIFKATGKTLIIKNLIIIKTIKKRNNSNILELFLKYKQQNGFKNLAQIFYRFKPLFLAFKTEQQLNHIINSIRKLAKKYHKPMPEDYLNEVTAKIKRGITVDKEKLIKELNKVNTSRKIRLAYALKYRTKDTSSIMYRVRNGKSFSKAFVSCRHTNTKLILDIVLNSIIEDISKNVKGKKIYIPKDIHYTLPATEKQFIGYFPTGTYITVSKDMVFGIHWKNVEQNRIDLDLSLINCNIGKIGWDGEYRSKDKSVLFSGDITDAPNGATESFYVKRQNIESFILLCNYYNYSEVKVPFKIFVAKEQISNLKENYTVNPNNVIAITQSEMDDKQRILGLLVTTTSECRFYFVESNIGKSISSSNTDFVKHSRQYLFDFYNNTISLNKILEKAGAKLIEDKEKCDIDLSSEKLEKDTILKLISKK